MLNADEYYDYLKAIGHEPGVKAIYLPIERPGVYDLADDTELLTDNHWLTFSC